MASPVRILSLDELAVLTRTGDVDGVLQGIASSDEKTTTLWNHLQATVHSPAVSDKHMTAACNAICFVARQHASSRHESAKARAYSSQTWSEIFLAARSAFSSSKNKPALQVLDTLAYLSKTNPDVELVRQQVSNAAETMAGIVFLQNPKKCLKEACIVLYFFLRKLSDFMSFSDVLRTVHSDTKSSFDRICRSQKLEVPSGKSGIESIWLCFITALLVAVPVAESKSATLKLLSLLPALPMSTTDVELKQVMREAVTTFSSAEESLMENVIKDVLPSILSDQDHFYALLPQANIPIADREAALRLYLAQLRFGKSKGYITEHDAANLLHGNLKIDYHPDLVHEAHAGYRLLMRNRSSTVRQGACELLLTGSSAKHLPSSLAFACLEDSLPFLHHDLDAFSRGELFSLFRQFLLSLRASQLYREASSQETETCWMTAAQILTHNYLAFLKAELAAQLSYGRHILALDLICFLLLDSISHGQGKLVVTILDQNTIIRLFNLVSDAYTDVRASAAQALSYGVMSADTQVASTLQAVENYYQPGFRIARTSARTNRADHADALGRTTAIITKIRSLSSDQDDASTALVHMANTLRVYICNLQTLEVNSTYPLHGNLLGMSYLLHDVFEDSFLDIEPHILPLLQEVCQHIWTLSQSHLCVDSPEMETEVFEDSGSSGPKDLLAYAWRALRDSNVLMQSMLEVLPTKFDLVQVTGNLCFEQLRLLRHRGAFSAVAQTFLMCCQKARVSSDRQVRGLTTQWLSEAFQELELQANRLTRRSAGLPAMFVASLNPSDSRIFLQGFNDLVALAIQPQPDVKEETIEVKLRLPQVHALNCIKDIMTNSRFRSMTESLVVRTLNLAAEAMSSSIWAIKNCGLMLLRASINRLDPDTSLGESEAGLKLRNGLDEAKTPLQIAVDMLHGSSTKAKDTMKGDSAISVDSASTEAVFAGLDLLSRLYIRNPERDMVRKLVTSTLGSSLWHIRAQAARLLSNMIAAGDELIALHEVSLLLAAANSTNKQHGLLLVFMHLVRRLTQISDPNEYLSELLSLGIFEKDNLFYKEPVSAAIWLGVLQDLYQAAGTDRDDHKILASMVSDARSRTAHGKKPAVALYHRAFVSVMLCFNAEDAGEYLDPERAFAAVNLLQEDEDSACWALEQVKGMSKHENTAGLLQLLKQYLSRARSEDSQAACLDAIVATAIADSQVLDSLDTGVLLLAIDFGKPVTRQLMISQLQLYALICKHAWETGDDAEILRAQRLSSSFCLHVRAAANEDTDDSSRHGALQALLQWQDIREIDSMTTSLFQDDNRLELLSIVYDYLNDDDEDIRSSACIMAARLCGPATTISPVTSILSAAASREGLRNRIAESFQQANQGNLQLECIRHVLGLRMEVHRSRLGKALARDLQIYTVKMQLDDIIATATDLFAEEKQNLYVDEVMEIRAWAQIARGLQITTDFREFLSTWVKDGLYAFLEYFSKPIDDIVEASVNFELLLIRVITLARILGDYVRVLEELRTSLETEHAGVHYHSRVSSTTFSAFTWSLQ